MPSDAAQKCLTGEKLSDRLWSRVKRWHQRLAKTLH